MKLHIDKEDWYKSGIYKISTTINNRFYIGSANDFYQRHASHKSGLVNNKHPSKQLQAFVNKHGIDKLIFSIVELVPNKEDLTTREQYYLDTLQPFGKVGYNTAITANSMLGFRHSSDTIEKFKNRKRTIQTPESIKKSADKRRGQKRSKETLEKFKIRSAKRHKPISQFDKQGSFIREYKYSRQVELETGINRANVLKSCKYKHKIVSNSIFLYSNDTNIVNGVIKKEEILRRLSVSYKKKTVLILEPSNKKQM